MSEKDKFECLSEAKKLTAAPISLDEKDAFSVDSFSAPSDFFENSTNENPLPAEEDESYYYEDIDAIRVLQPRTSDDTHDDEHLPDYKTTEDVVDPSEITMTTTTTTTDGSKKDDSDKTEKEKSKGKIVKESRDGDQMNSGENEEEEEEEEAEASGGDIYLDVDREYSKGVDNADDGDDDDRGGGDDDDGDGDMYLEVVRPQESKKKDERITRINKTWYWGDVDRAAVEEVLNKFLDKDGTFLVRKSKSGGPDNPFAISVVNAGEIVHVLVRRREDGKMAAGKAKFGEKKFADLIRLVEFYQDNDLTLYDSHGNVTAAVQLTESPGN